MDGVIPQRELNQVQGWAPQVQPREKIWLALGGGGLASTAFAAGALYSLNGNNLRPRAPLITRVSSVSGTAIALSAFAAHKLHQFMKDSQDSLLDDYYPKLELQRNLFSLVCSVLITIIVAFRFQTVFDGRVSNQGTALIFEIQLAIFCLSIALLIYFFVRKAYEEAFLPSRKKYMLYDPTVQGNQGQIVVSNGEENPARVNAVVPEEEPRFPETYKEKLQMNFGFLVNTNQHFKSLVDYPRLEWIAKLWVTLFDTFWMLVFFFLIPLVFLVANILPFAILIADLAIRYPGPFFWRVFPTTCNDLGNQWVTANQSVSVTADQILFALPLTVAGSLLSFESVRCVWERCSSRPSKFLQEIGLIRLQKLFCVCAFLSMGICLSLTSDGLVCTGLSDLFVWMETVIVIFAFIISFSYIPELGGFIAGSILVSLFTFLVVNVIGPPPLPDGEIFMANPNNHISDPQNGTVMSLFAQSVRNGWNYYLCLAGTLVILLPNISLGKTLILHFYYRFRISKSYFLGRFKRPSRGDRCRGPLRKLFRLCDFLLQDVLRVPFSISELEFFPYDSTTIDDFRLYNEDHGKNGYYLDLTFGMNSSILLKRDGKSPGKVSPISSKAPDDNDLGKLAQTNLVTLAAVAGSGLSESVNEKRSLPVFLISLIGTKCSRWFRKGRATGLDRIVQIVFMTIFAALGVSIFVGGQQCILDSASSVWVSGTVPCGNEPSIVLPELVLIGFCGLCCLFLLVVPLSFSLLTLLGILESSFMLSLIGLTSTFLKDEEDSKFTRVLMGNASQEDSLGLKVFFESLNSAPVAEIPRAIICMDGNGYLSEKHEFTGLINLARMAKENNLIVRTDTIIRRKKAFQNIPAYDLKLVLELFSCSTNQRLDALSGRTAENEEAENYRFLNIAVHNERNVKITEIYYVRPNLNGLIKDAEPYNDGHLSPVLTRAMSLMGVSASVFAFFGALISMGIELLFLFCGGVNSSNDQFFAMGLFLACLVLIGEVAILHIGQKTKQNLLMLAVLSWAPVTQVVSSRFKDVFILVWAVSGALAGLMAGYLFQRFVKKFPNHRVSLTQLFPNESFFDRYFDSGKALLDEVLDEFAL